MSNQTNTTHMPPTPLIGDAASLVGILDWALGAGVDVSELTVGAVSIKLRGTLGADAQGDERDDGQRRGDRPSIHEQFGGELFERALAEKVAGVDLQPVVGRSAP